MPFKNMFGRESIEQMIQRELYLAKVALFNVRLELDNCRAVEQKLMVRIGRLQNELGEGRDITKG